MVVDSESGDAKLNLDGMQHCLMVIDGGDLIISDDDDHFDGN